MATLPGERTGLLAPTNYEEEARANAGQACGIDQQKKDMAWTCSSSAALIILVAIIILPLALFSYSNSDGDHVESYPKEECKMPKAMALSPADSHLQLP